MSAADSATADNMETPTNTSGSEQPPALPDKIPDKQKAWREIRRGHPAQALELQEVPVTKNLAPGELLVKVEAAALNPLGYKLMELLPNPLAKRPHTAEFDFSGTVVATQGVSEFKVDDEVCGWLSSSMQQVTSQGALSEYVRVKSDFVIPRPKNLTSVQAAGLCMAGIVAWQMLHNYAKIQPKQHILINGGSSSVGSNCIQIAKAHGCHVTATTSSTNYDFVGKLGADTVIDYSKCDPIHENLTSEPPDPLFDVIIDCVGTSNDLFTHSEAYLAADGVFVSVGPWTNSLVSTASHGLVLAASLIRPKWLGGSSRAFRLFQLENSKSDLRNLHAMVSEGKLKPIVDSVFKFDEVLLAYERIMTKRARGKVVVVLDPKLADETPQVPPPATEPAL